MRVSVWNKIGGESMEFVDVNTVYLFGESDSPALVAQEPGDRSRDRAIWVSMTNVLCVVTDEPMPDVARDD